MSDRLSRRSLMAGSVGLVSAAQTAEPVRLPKKVRVALWGLDGHTGEIVNPLPRYPDVELVAVQSANQAAAARFAKGKAHVYTDPIKMLDTEKPDLVAVCNNDGERAGAILEAAKRGLPVIAEKPLAIKRADFEQVRKLVEANHVKLGMLLPMRFDPPYLALKQIAESGELGDIIQISAQKSYKLGTRPEWQRRRDQYGSTILWIGIHMIDLMRWTSGREMKAASSFQGVAGNMGAGEMETSTTTSFLLDNGGTGTLHMDYCRPELAPSHGDDRLRLAGTKGVAEYMLATGVTLVSSKRKLEKIEALPPARSIFGEFLEFVYLGKPTSLPHSEIYRICEITMAAHDAAVTGKVISL